MSFRKFTAGYLFTGRKLLRNHVLITDQNGLVKEIIPSKDAGDGVENFDGILTPGFVNSHCHIELSHLKGVIPPHTGLIEFLLSVVQKRGFEKEVVQAAIEHAENEMYNNGIVAVGDICNTTDAVTIKSKSRLHWHSFIEVLSFTDEKADENIRHYKEVLSHHKSRLGNHCVNVITPHAPYSISPKTFELINAETSGRVISVHNQEHPAEDDLYRTGDSEYLRLFKFFGIHRSPFPVTGKSSIQSWLPYFTNGQTIFIVHNTYMAEEDVVFANKYANRNGLKLVYCICANANQYIENSLPPLDLFMKHNCHIVIGTDSYSSNWELSIAREVQTIRTSRYFNADQKESALEMILQWATFNGAQALKIEDRFGSFDPGKQPGIVLLRDDFSAERLL